MFKPGRELKVELGDFFEGSEERTQLFMGASVPRLPTFRGYCSSSEPELILHRFLCEQVCFGDDLRLAVKAAKLSAGDSVIYSIAEKGKGDRGGKDNAGGGGGGASLSGSYEVTAEDLDSGEEETARARGGGGGKESRRGRQGRGQSVWPKLPLLSLPILLASTR